MKLTIFIMTLFLLQVSAATKAQITLNTKQESLLKVLDKISKQSGYDLIYTVQDFKNANPVTIKLNNVSVEQALKEVFSGQPLIYEVSEKTVMVKRKEEKENSIIDRIRNYFDNITIMGTVLDENGINLPGASIKVKNGKGNTLSGTKGEFYLKNVDERAIIEITYIGYKKKEMPAQTMMGFIKMELSDNKLDEVQIQFSGTTTKRLSTSNITTIKAADIAKQPVDNPLYALQGRVPGLIITPSSGNPNAPVKVQLRGQNSLSTVESEPLFVIDGVPFANNIGGVTGAATTPISAMSFINPSDIESVDVLKDADATAIYGSRGANGVILITTKKGRMGSTKIDANVSVGFTTIPTRAKMMNTQQYLQMRREAFANDGLPVPGPNIPDGEKNASNYDLTIWDPNRYTDWQKEFLSGTGKSLNSNVSISGGNDLVRYSISGTYNKTGLPTPGDSKQEMGTGTFNISGNSRDRKLSLSLTGSYSANKSSIPLTDFTKLAYTLPPNAPALYNADGTLNWEPNLSSAFGEATWTNPMAALLQSNTSTNTAINSSANIAYDTGIGLKLSVVAGFNKVLADREILIPIASFDPAYFQFLTGSSQFGNTKSTNWSVQPQLNYTRAIGKGKLDVLIGGSLQAGVTADQSINAYGYTSDALLRSLEFATNFIGGNSGTEYKYTGGFARIGYNWDDRYIVNFNGRRDGSSRFGPGYQFGNFGSVGAAWVFTNESFLKGKTSVISFGKLRASLGTNGNDQIGDYKYLELFSPDVTLNYQGRPILMSSGATNPDYHWEKKSSLELGFDLGFFKERLVLSGSYFRARSNNQLLQYSLPATAGSPYGILYNQDARIQNRGMELSLSSTNIVTNGFRWTSALNLSFANKNKILALPTDPYAFLGRLGNIYSNTTSLQDLIGKPYGGVVGVYEFRGIDPATGIPSFADGNGKTIVGTGDDRAKLIDLNPKYYGGLSNQFSYKNFTLDIFLEFKKQIGRSFYGNDVLGSVGQPVNLPIEYLDRWQKPGDNALFPKVSQSYANGLSAVYMGLSDAGYTDASYLRIKNIALSFELPASLKQKLHLQSFSVFANAQNVLTITGYKGADPEAQSFLALPPLRVIQTGVRLGF